MDPVQKIWMFHNWAQDQKDHAELAKNHAYLLGSFWNPEAVKDLMGDRSGFESSEEDFEESTKLIRDDNFKIDYDLLGDNKNNFDKKVKRRIK